MWATPTAQPAVGAAAPRALQASGDQVCVTHRTFNATNTTRTSIALVIDATDLQLVNVTDAAAFITATLARTIELPGTLLNFSTTWTECTGVDASVIQVLQAPAVRTGLRPSPSSQAFPAGAAATLPPASELSLPAIIVVGLVVLAALLACCCCDWAVCARRQGLPPLPVLHVSLPGDRLVLLPLRWGSVLGSEGRLGAAAVLRARTRRHHALLLDVPADATYCEPLGLRSDSLSDHVGLPVAIMEPAPGAAGGKEKLRPVRWYSDGKCGDDSGRDAPLYSDGWVVSCPGLMALEAPRPAPSAPPARAVLALRAATLAERQLVLRGGSDTPGLPAVAPGAVLSSSELARLVQAGAATDAGAAV